MESMTLCVDDSRAVAFDWFIRYTAIVQKELAPAKDLARITFTYSTSDCTALAIVLTMTVNHVTSELTA